MYAKRLGALGLTALLVSGCSGGHGSTTLPTLPRPVASTPTSHASGTAKFVIRVPAKTHAVASRALADGRGPLYISASSQSVAIAVNGGMTPTVANLTPSSANCTAATQTAPLTCTVSVPAPQGSDTFAVTTYDQQNAVGNALSRATVAATISWRYGLAAGVVNGILYAVGGYNNSGASNTVEAYDPATDTWTTRASMPTGRYGLAAGVVNGLLYAVDGYNNSGVSNTLEAYDPATETWTPKAPMPTAQFYLAAGVVNGVIYPVGGYNSGAVNTLEAYTP